MKIGTDCSLEVCKAEGYLIAEFTKGKLLPRGKFNPDCSVNFYRYYPEYLEEEGITGKQAEFYMTANEIWEIYESKQAEINSYIGEEIKFPTNEYELLNLADSVDSYLGLSNY